ncbi:MAG: Ig-like domain-containing protein [Clostridia bacterium]|nr:Ig-like domain-containing protein [Clostridia bacterium]
MKKSSIKRAISLAAALALLLTTAGLAEMPSASEPFEEMIVAEAVDAAVESEEIELELGDDPDSGDTASDDTVSNDTASDDSGLDAAEETETPVDAVDVTVAEDIPAFDEPTPDEATPTAEEPAPETAEDAGEKPSSDVAESPEEESPAKSAEDQEESEAKSTEDSTEDKEKSAEDQEKPEATAAEDKEASEAKAADTPEGAPALEADATVETSAKATAEATPESPAEAAAPSAEAAGAEAAPSALTFAAPKFFMGKGEYLPFTALSADTGAPVEATLTSNKPGIVKVEGTGVLHARKKGTAKITATAANGVKATCVVKVVKAPSKIRLTPKKLIIGLEEGHVMKAKLPKGSASAITWTSSNPAVATVDAAGNLRTVGVGTARVTATTFNKKKASCRVTVLAGHTPTALTFPAATIYMGNKEKLRLSPVLGPGEAALFTFSSSKKSVVSVNKNGLMVAKKKGTAKITVKTHNGLKFRLTVRVIKAPSKVTLSKSKLSLQVGQGATLAATLPSKTASAITWTSSNANVASVDAAGNVAALNPGMATITAKTFNGKKATCAVTVTAPSTDLPSNAQMVANIRNSSLSKRSSLAGIAELMLNNGYEPAFAAGVCANASAEGDYGRFESSKYIQNYQKRPRYFCFLDGGDYYTKDANGTPVITDVYLSPEEAAAYTGPANVHLRFGEEKYYWNNWSGKYVWNINLDVLEAFMNLLTDAKLLNGQPDGWNDGKGWHGKFGLGCTQWTGGRTRKLLKLYRKYAGEGNPTITKEQVIAAEHEMILYDLQGDYKKVYTNWRDENISNLNSTDAANRAGYRVCRYYEIPAGGEARAVKRGNSAVNIYKIMIGAA